MGLTTTLIQSASASGQKRIWGAGANGGQRTGTGQLMEARKRHLQGGFHPASREIKQERRST